MTVDCYCTKNPNKSEIDESKLFLLAQEIDTLIARIDKIEQKLNEKKTRKSKAAKTDVAVKDAETKQDVE